MEHATLEAAMQFPLTVTRAADGQYVVAAVGMGFKKTGRDLAVTEQAMRAALSDMLALMERHGIENAHIPPATACAELSLETQIMRWAKIILLVLLISLPVWFGVQRLQDQLFRGLSTAEVANKVIARTAEMLASIQPQQRAELAHNINQMAIGLQPYAAQLRPVWVACCEQPHTQPPSTQPAVKEAE